MPTYSPNIINHNIARSTTTIDGLNASTAEKFSAFYTDVFGQLGILLLVYSGSRSYPEQWELRKKFLEGGALAARPGESWHNFKRAADVVPLFSNGSANWESRDYQKIADIAKRHGLKWGGSFGDSPHFYDDAGVSLGLLKHTTPGWKQYHDQEAQLTKSTLPVPIEPITAVTRDNWQIVKKVALVGGTLGILLYIGSRIYAKTKKSKKR